MEQARSIGLIVEADEPLLLFSSPKAAEAYMEAIDVRNGVYTAAYDPQGNPFAISAVGEQVVISPAEQGGNRADRLRKLLVDFLRRQERSPPTGEALDALLATCSPYVIE